MDGDIAAIESWATIFTKPTELAETVGKNWLLHRRTIKADLAKEQSDWSSGNYFQAGVDTAMALTEAVGPVPKTATESLYSDVDNTEMLGFDLVAAPEFVAGFLQGLT